MQLVLDPTASYLASDPIVDVTAAPIAALAAELGAGEAGYARAAFEWVRDRVTHSADAGDPRVTVTAVEALETGTGLCFAKSHLLVALLRAGGVPAGFCYQRLSDGDGFVLHGLVAARLDGGWRRLDPRGNRDGVDAQFDGRLAYEVDPDAGEVDYPQVLERPAPEVLHALRAGDDVLVIAASGLPSELVLH